MRFKKLFFFANYTWSIHVQFDNTTALLTTAKSLKNAKLIVVMDTRETKKR